MTQRIELPAVPGEKTGASLLTELKTRISQTLPGFNGPERFMQICMQTFRTTPKLLECEMTSLVAALMQSAKEGLEPGEECYLIPRWNGRSKKMECVYQRSFQGALTLARRSGAFANVSYGTVHENDEYHMVEGTENRLVVKRNMTGDRGKVLFYWFATTLKDGEASFTTMTVRDAEEHRDKFASTKDKNGKVFGPWVDHFDAMALKTVLLKHLKYQPKSFDRETISIDGKALTIGKQRDALPVLSPSIMQDDPIDEPRTDDLAVSCPDYPDTETRSSFCQKECHKRQGCPAWPDDEPALNIEV